MTADWTNYRGSNSRDVKKICKGQQNHHSHSRTERTTKNKIKKHKKKFETNRGKLVCESEERAGANGDGGSGGMLTKSK